MPFPLRFGILLVAIIGCGASGSPNLRGVKPELRHLRSPVLYNPNSGAFPSLKKSSNNRKDKVGNDWRFDSPWHNTSPVIRIEADKDRPFGYMSTILHLSPDGRTMMSAYSLASTEMIGTTSFSEKIDAYEVHMFTFTQDLWEWIPTSSFTVNGFCAECVGNIFDIQLASHSVAVMQFGVAQNEDGPLVFGPVQVWSLNSWSVREPPLRLGPPLHPSTEGYGIFSVAITDEAKDIVNENVVVAVGTLCDTRGDRPEKPGFVEVWTPITIQEENYWEHLEWKQLGQGIQGPTAIFGLSVKLSRDGSIVAVTGADDPPEATDDDEDVSLSCYIRLYQYSVENDKWEPLGDAFYHDKDPYMYQCPGISLSADGHTVVSGSHNYEKDCPETPEPNGHVRVWTWHSQAGKWQRKGPDLDTLVAPSREDLDYGFGMDSKVSADGNRVTVSGFETVSFNQVHGKKDIFYVATFDWVDGNWTQAPQTIEIPGWPQFAMDANGTNVAVASMLPEQGSPSGLIETYRYRRSSRTQSEKPTTRSYS